MGATRWETVRSHVLPYAAPGILTGTILALARAFGETAPLIMVGAIVGHVQLHASPIEQIMSEPFTALPTVVYNWSREPQDEFRALTAAAIVVLLVVILLVNARRHLAPQPIRTKVVDPVSVKTDPDDRDSTGAWPIKRDPQYGS